MPRLEFYGITFVGIVLITVLRLGAGYLSAAGLRFAFYG